MQPSSESNRNADLTFHDNQETWIDLGKYESFVMKDHTARETEEWLEKWSERWTRIEVDGDPQRSKI